MGVFEKYGIKPDLSGYNNNSALSGFASGFGSQIDNMAKSWTNYFTQKKLAGVIEELIKSGGSNPDVVAQAFSLGVDPYAILKSAQAIAGAKDPITSEEAYKRIFEQLIPVATKTGQTVPKESYTEPMSVLFGDQMKQTTQEGVVPGQPLESINTQADTMFGNLVNKEKEAVGLEQEIKETDLESKKQNILHTQAQTSDIYYKQHKDELDEAKKELNKWVDMAMDAPDPMTAEQLLSVNNLSSNSKQVLIDAGVLKDGDTTIVPSVEGIISTAAYRSGQEAQEMQMKLQQLEISKGNLAVSQGQLGLSQERFNWEKQKDLLAGGTNKNDFTPKMIADLGNFILLGDTSTDLAQALIANAAKQAGIKLEEKVGSGYLTKLGSGQYKSSDEMWAAYKQEIQPYIRRFYSPEIEKEIVLGMMETLQARGLPIPQTMTTEAGTMGQTSSVGLSPTEKQQMDLAYENVKKENMSKEEAIAYAKPRLDNKQISQAAYDYFLSLFK